MIAVCPHCRELNAGAATAIAALVAAVEADDLDGAIDVGLLQFDHDTMTPCDRCRPLIDRLIAARDARRVALAARERYRQRNARIERRARERAAKRVANAPAAGGASIPALPPAAAAALARAKARAADRK